MSGFGPQKGNWMGLFQTPGSFNSAPQLHSNTQQAMPQLVQPAWPHGMIDPRGYQPGFDPNHAPGMQGSPFTGFTFLALGALGLCPENSISFGSDLSEKMVKAGAPVAPGPWVLTLAPSTTDLIALGLGAGGDDFNLYYKIEYVFPAQYPDYIEGSFQRASASQNGYLPLSPLGIKVQLRNWAVRIWVKATGALAGADWGGKKVRFDAFLSPGALPAGASGNLIKSSVSLLGTDGYLPTFAASILIPLANGAGGTIAFQDLANRPVATYVVGTSPEFPIPVIAVRMTSTAERQMLIRCY